MAHARMLAILSTADLDGLAHEVAGALGEPNPTIIHGTCEEAVRMMQASNMSPRYVLVDFGTRRDSVLHEIDMLSQACEPGTRVVAVRALERAPRRRCDQGRRTRPRRNRVMSASSRRCCRPVSAQPAGACSRENSAVEKVMPW